LTLGERREDRQPTPSGRRQSHERIDPSAQRTAAGQKVHSRTASRSWYTREHVGRDERLKRFRNFGGVMSDINREAFGRQKSAWVMMEKEKQIDIARGP